MAYTISQVAEMMGVTPSTLRYYDQQGLLPNLSRQNGVRQFEAEDFQWLRVLHCLKNTGMPIKKIKSYIDLVQDGDASLQARSELIQEQKAHILKQIAELEYYLQEIEFKEWYYARAMEAGTEAVVAEFSSKRATMELDQIPDDLR